MGAEAVRHLTTYGVNPAAVEVDAQHRRIGDALDTYITWQKPDLLVMGAYGRSRDRELILGGATEHVLNSQKAA